MNFLNLIKKIFLHLLKRILQITMSVLTSLACAVIYIVTFEPNTLHKATDRKVKRIRFLTKLKVYAYKWFKPFWKFTNNTYLEKVYNNFSFLIEK